MTEQNETQSQTQTTQVVESAEEFIQKDLPIYAHRSGRPVVVGSAVVTRYKDRVELAAKLETTDGIELGSLLTAEYNDGISLGGILNPEFAKRIQ